MEGRFLYSGVGVMKASGYLLGILVLFCACSSDKAVFESDMLFYQLHLKGDPSDLVYTQRYALENGRVLSEEFTNYNNPEYSRTSRFAYDNEGRIIQETQDGEISTTVEWDVNTANIYDAEGDMYAQIEMDGEKIILHRQFSESGDPQITEIKYDSQGNVIAEESPSGSLVVTFNDYDTTKMYPLYLIRSISILRMSYRAHFKNIFSIEKREPYEGDDFSIGVTEHQYFYTFDRQERVETIEDEASLIYTHAFEYE